MGDIITKCHKWERETSSAVGAPLSGTLGNLINPHRVRVPHHLVHMPGPLSGMGEWMDAYVDEWENYSFIHHSALSESMCAQGQGGFYSGAMSYF